MEREPRPRNEQFHGDACHETYQVRSGTEKQKQDSHSRRQPRAAETQGPKRVPAIYRSPVKGAV